MWSCERNPNLNLSLKCNLIHLFTSKTASLVEKHGWGSVYLSDTQLYSFLACFLTHGLLENEGTTLFATENHHYSGLEAITRVFKRTHPPQPLPKIPLRSVSLHLLQHLVALRAARAQHSEHRCVFSSLISFSVCSALGLLLCLQPNLQ